MMFRGISPVIIDAKGRIKLPVRCRELLVAENQSQVVVTIDTESPCLLLYPAKAWEIIEERLQGLPSFNPAARRIQRLLIGHATDLELDNNGRILLPGLLREYAALNKEVRVVGQGQKLELWSASEWDHHRTLWIEEAIKLGDLPNELQSLAL